MISVIKMVTIYLLHISGMTGPCTGPALLSKESSESFSSVSVCVQEIKYCFCARKSTWGGCPTSGWGRELRSGKDRAPEKPLNQLETKTEIEIWRGNWNLCHWLVLLEIFTHFSIEENKEWKVVGTNCRLYRGCVRVQIAHSTPLWMSAQGDRVADKLQKLQSGNIAVFCQKGFYRHR